MNKVIDPLYKKGEPFSLRTYTVVIESKYLLFKNLPKLSLLEELQSLLTSHGLTVVKAHYIDDQDIFTADDIAQGVHLYEAVLV